jgi:hypothetical protein
MFAQRRWAAAHISCQREISIRVAIVFFAGSDFRNWVIEPCGQKNQIHHCFGIFSLANAA